MSKIHRTIQTMLGIWIVVALVMVARMHNVDLGVLAPTNDATEAAKNYKECQDEVRALYATGQLPTR